MAGRLVSVAVMQPAEPRQQLPLQCSHIAALISGELWRN